MIKRLAITLTLCCISLGAISQGIDTKWQKFALESTNAQRAANHKFHLVKLKKGSKTAILYASGLEVVRKLDQQHFIVKELGATQLAKNEGVALHVPANNLWKLSGNIKSSFLQKGSQLIVHVTNPEAFRVALLSEALKKYFDVIYEQKHTFILKTVSTVGIEKLLNQDVVTFLSSQDANGPVDESRVLGMDFTINQITTLKTHQPSLDGSDLLISVNERQYDTTDMDILGRNVPSGREFDEVKGHATDMATIIAGAGNSSRSGLGIAPAANISSTSFFFRLPDPDSYYQTSDIHVQNHSWGDSIIRNDFYGEVAAAYDQSANNNSTLLHVFSIGNSGLGQSDEGTYKDIPSMANITGEFKMAKNLLTVGSVDWNLNHVSDISRGPAYDGRVKPELCAFNVNGSSGAAATVSGIASLLQQDYKNKHAGALPDATLLRAILINSADDAGQEGLDYFTGYGSVNAWKAYQTLNNENYASGTVSHGNEVVIPLVVPANARNLKITLVWNDPAAAANAGIALVNNLDMVLTTPTASQVLPWVLNHAPDFDSLVLKAERKKDDLNTIEQVSIAIPEAGAYQVRISGFDIPTGSQEFFIAYEWESANTFDWRYPLEGNNMPYLGEGNAISQDASYFRWNANFDTEMLGQLEYSVDNGTTWELISDAVDLSAGEYLWETPDTFALAHARMTIDGTIYQTEEFVLSRQFNTTVGFNCEDSVQFNWPYKAAADQYKVYQLGSKYMEEIATTTDTFIVLNNVSPSDLIYSIEPVFANGKTGVRSPAFNYTEQGVECYTRSFFPILNEAGTAIELHLLLGTTYGVSGVTFQRKSGDQFVTVVTVSDVTSTEIVVEDVPETPGLQVYRALIHFDNGGELSTNEVEIYFLSDELPVLVFPNPVLVDGELNIFTKFVPSEFSTFQLYDVNGRLLIKRTLFSDREFFKAEGVGAGVYIYRIEVDGHVEVGRLLVQ